MLHLQLISSYGKGFNRGIIIEACYDIFFNEIIEYDITNE